jgi:homoserine dehydrogenase
MLAEDKPGVMGQVTNILGESGISIEAIVQKEPAPGATQVPIIMLTHRVHERQMNQAIGEIEALPAIAGRVTRIRVEGLE